MILFAADISNLNSQFTTFNNNEAPNNPFAPKVTPNTPRSSYWILHLPDGRLFSDAREAGVFVRGLVSRLETEEKSGELRSRGRHLLAENLFVHAEGKEDGADKLASKGKPARFIDLGVYTRNRIFRLMGSTKFGKPADAALRIAEANEFPFPSGFDNSKFYLPETNKGAANNAVADDNDGTDAVSHSGGRRLHPIKHPCMFMLTFALLSSSP